MCDAGPPETSSQRTMKVFRMQLIVFMMCDCVIMLTLPDEDGWSIKVTQVRGELVSFGHSVMLMCESIFDV